MQKYHVQGLKNTFLGQKINYFGFQAAFPGSEQEKTRSGNAFWEVVAWEGGNRKSYFHLHSGGQGKGSFKGETPSTKPYSPPDCSLPGNSPIMLGKLLGGEWSHEKGKGKKFPPPQSQPFPFQSVTRWESFALQHTETHKVNQNNRKKQGKSVYPLVLEQPKLTILG